MIKWQVNGKATERELLLKCYKDSSSLDGWPFLPLRYLPRDLSEPVPPFPLSPQLNDQFHVILVAEGL